MELLDGRREAKRCERAMKRKRRRSRGLGKTRAASPLEDWCVACNYLLLSLRLIFGSDCDLPPILLASIER